MDDEGLCIIDQHVAHERVLFERIMQRLTSESLGEPAAADPGRCSSCRRPSAQALMSRCGRAGAIRLRSRRSSAATASRSRRCRRCCAPDECDAALRALADDLEGLDRGLRIEDALKQIAATTACHAAVKAQLPADAREDAPHPRGAARDGVLDRLPARPPGDAAHHPARDRKELRSDLGPLIEMAFTKTSSSFSPRGPAMLTC